jgi:hypothetical protein
MKASLVAWFHRRAARRAQRQMRRHTARHLTLQMFFLAGIVLLGIGLFHPTLAFLPPVAQETLVPLRAGLLPQPETGWGAGNSVATPDFPTMPALCNPFDPSCYVNSIGASTAQTILNGLKPVTDFVQNSSTDILTQTPPDDSYANGMVIAINQALVRAVDVALACLLLIGGYNVILGHHLRIERSSITELLPRAILVTCAVHFNLLFLGLFIDLNNALCNTVVTVTSAETLATLIAGFRSVNPWAGFILVILIIVAVIMLILLLAQMITRIALVALLIAVAPLALACLALPQTMRWGRLWFTAFSSAVLVQFLQVTALALGGLLITSIGNTPIWHAGHELAEVFLAIGMMIITLQIPGMMQTWALHPMTNASGWLMEQASPGGSGSGGGSSSSSSSVETAAKVAELLAML